MAFIVLPSGSKFVAAEFNWGPVMFAGVMTFALLYFFLGGRKSYAGPVTIVKNEGEWAR